MSSGDHDADAIRNQRLHKLLPKLERLVNALDGGGAPASGGGDEAAAKQAFDLGNRVEDALKRLDEKMRAIGDLPDVLRAKCDEVDKLTQSALELGQALEKTQAEAQTLLADLKAAQAKPEAEQPAKPAMPPSEGGHDGPQPEQQQDAPQQQA